MNESVRSAIDALLRPRSLAIVGASSNPSGLGGRPLEIVRQHGFSGALHVVNPRASTIGGLATVPSIADIGAPVDLAAILVAPELVPKVIDECGAAGVTAAYIFTSGFAEASEGPGEQLEDELRAACARWPIRVAGPNGEGVFNAADRFALTFSPVVDFERGLAAPAIPGSVGVVAHSGGIAFGVLSQGMARGIRFGHVISTGNEVDLELMDYFDYLVDDPGTRVIVLFVEGFKDPSRLRGAAHRAALHGKRVVVMKIGRTEEGQRAALSHTGHMSGRSDLYSSLFRHYGFVEVDDMDSLLDVTTMLATETVPFGRGAGIFTASGGAGAWLTDALYARGLSVPELGERERAEIAALLPYYANCRNPVDYTGGAQDQSGVQRSLEILAGASSIDFLVVVLSLMNQESVARRLPMLLEAVRSARKPMVVYTYTEPSTEAITLLAEAGVPWFRSQTGLANAVACAVQQAAAIAVRAGDPEPIAASATAKGWATLTEHAVKTLLGAADLPTPAGELVHGVREAVSAAERIGYPVVLKLQSVAASHKTELGAVAIDLKTQDEVEQAWVTVTKPVGNEVPSNQFDGVLVEAMAPAGVEMIIGVITDPGLGPFVLIGSGGVAAELLHDVVILPAPTTPDAACAAIRELRLAPVLTGWRGRPPADVSALAATVAAVSELSCGDRVIRELDLNPVVVYREGEGLQVLDGLAVVGDQEG
jgi:acetate---CoA ligase (ADP-forming)